MPRRLLFVPVCAVLGWAACRASAADPTPTEAVAAPDASIRTPPAPPVPRINGARVYGMRPGHPFAFHLPTTGERPIRFAAAGLPAGLTLDAATGEVTGTAPAAGRYAVTFTASNDQGQAQAVVEFVCGDQIALTPPMGFNTWNHFATHISDAKIRAAADAFVASGLREHGWSYINIDDGWQGQRDAGGNIQGGAQFPDMKALGDYIHARGLKFGVYSSPGPKTCAGFAGSAGHEDQDARTYAGWGVDYVKYDLCSYGGTIDAHRHQFLLDHLPEHADALKAAWAERNQLASMPGKERTPEQQAHLHELDEQIKALEAAVDPALLREFNVEEQQHPYAVFARSLAAVPRDIVYSFCQYGNADVWKWGASRGGNSWRTTGDISANWKSMSGIGFRQNDLAPYAGPGHWNDPDMLEVGNRGLTPDECYTHVTLWSMLAAPLLIGCDLTTMDPLTVSLFSNDEVLAIDQDALGRQATRLRQDGDREVWTRPLADGSLAVTFFNRGESPAVVSVSWRELALPDGEKARVRDLWRQQDIPNISKDRPEGLARTVAPHGAELLRVTPPSVAAQ